MFFGLDFFDAINHFLNYYFNWWIFAKNKLASCFQNPWIEAVILIFMLLAGTNFTLIYFALKMKFHKILKNDEI